MNIDERLNRIEHITAGLAEERRKDRDEYKALWRDTQRHINEITVRLGELTIKVSDTNDAITRLAEETRVADRKLGERIDSLVSAMGEFIRRQDAEKQ